MQAIYDLTIEELENYFEAKNEKIYKAKYLYNFLYKEKQKIRNVAFLILT